MTDPASGPSAGGFDLNHPTIIALLYLASYVTGITGLIGIVLCYVWKADASGTWAESHLQYLANTFWIGLVGGIIGFLLLIVLIGFPILAAVGILCLVRIIMSIVNAQKQQPMPNPSTFLV